MFDQIRCATDQFINCTVFDKLRNIWSIVQRTCNRVRVMIMIKARVWVRVSFRVRVRLAQLAKCTACFIKCTAHLVKYVD